MCWGRFKAFEAPGVSQEYRNRVRHDFSPLQQFFLHLGSSREQFQCQIKLTKLYARWKNSNRMMSPVGLPRCPPLPETDGSCEGVMRLMFIRGNGVFLSSEGFAIHFQSIQHSICLHMFPSCSFHVPLSLYINLSTNNQFIHE